MYKKITSFKQIEISNKKTLIICDIDDTVLKYKKSFSYFLDDMYQFPGETDLKNIHKDTLAFYQMYKIIQPEDIEHTDYKGYCEMLQKLSPESGLIFLTARTTPSEQMTRQQFNIIGIDEPKRDIYYTDNKCSKGEYMKKFMNFSGWDDIIFIDDSEQQIFSVMSKFPNIRNYLFCIE